LELRGTGWPGERSENSPIGAADTALTANKHSQFWIFVHPWWMLLFLATVLEQLDLAHEHVIKGDVHNARFGLMLTDNAIELIFHRLAKDQSSKLKSFMHGKEEYPHRDVLDKALGRAFDAKVKFAKLDGKLSDEDAQTITIMHSLRNEVYHVGLQHEAILPALALFYFEVVCTHLSRYKVGSYGWGSNQQFPERAKKYFKGTKFSPGSPDDFVAGCATLAQSCGHVSAQTIATLHEHLSEVVSRQNTYIDVISGGVYKGQETTRDNAVIDSQVWPLAFSEEGKQFGRERGYRGSIKDFIPWLTKEYPLKFKGDPIPGWRKRVEKLRIEKNPHTALFKYHAFMSDTAKLREELEEACGQVEAEIDAAIDRARGK